MVESCSSWHTWEFVAGTFSPKGSETASASDEEEFCLLLRSFMGRDHCLGTYVRIPQLTTGTRGSSGLILGLAEAGHPHPAHLAPQWAGCSFTPAKRSCSTTDCITPSPRGVPRLLEVGDGFVTTAQKSPLLLSPVFSRAGTQLELSATSSHIKTTVSIHITVTGEMRSSNYFL